MPVKIGLYCNYKRKMRNFCHSLVHVYFIEASKKKNHIDIRNYKYSRNRLG